MVMAAGEAFSPAAMTTDAWPVLPKPQTLQRQRSNRTRFFTHGYDRIAPDTHQDQANGDQAAGRPGGPCCPRRTLVPLRVQWIHHRPVAAEGSAPIPGWLTLQAIRWCCQPVTAIRHPIQTKWLLLQSPVPGLPAAVVTHAKQRVTSKGWRSFSMW